MADGQSVACFPFKCITTMHDTCCAFDTLFQLTRSFLVCNYILSDVNVFYSWSKINLDMMHWIMISSCKFCLLIFYILISLFIILLSYIILYILFYYQLHKYHKMSLRIENSSLFITITYIQVILRVVRIYP